MIRQVTIAGVECPADFSIMTLAALADEYGTDITGLAEMLRDGKSATEHIRFVARVGVAALNAGALRAGVEKRYTEYDIYDEMTADMTIAEQLLGALGETFKGEAVFPMPSVPTAKPKKKKGGE